MIYMNVKIVIEYHLKANEKPYKKHILNIIYIERRKNHGTSTRFI